MIENEKAAREEVVNICQDCINELNREKNTAIVEGEGKRCLEVFIKI